MLKRSRGLAGFSAAVVGLLLAGGSPPASRPAQQAAPTPMQLFSKLLPVIRHDRCSNCHGDVDPIAGDNHEAGAETPDHCHNCHKLVKDWTTPQPAHFFPKKTDRELCGLYSDFAAKQGHPLFISNHLRGDELIVAAFEGKAGGAREDPPAKPPMEQEEFIRLAEDWLVRGQGACDVEGTINLVETVHSVDSSSYTPQMTNVISQEGSRTVAVTLANDRYQAKIHLSGTISELHIQHVRGPKGPCDVTLKQLTTYSGTTTGPATVTAKDTVFFGDTHPELGQTDYRIDVTLPEEHTLRTRKVEILDGCGAGITPPTPSETLTLDWPRSSFTLEGHLDDRKTVNLVGSCDRPVTKPDVRETKGVLEMDCNRFKNMGNSEEPWLMKQMWLETLTGKDIPVRVQSFWNLRYRK